MLGSPSSSPSTRIGAPHSVIFGGFSAQAIADRVIDASPKFIVGTETGILHTMHKAAPDKELIAVPYEDRTAACQGCNTCPHMKLNTLEKIYLALRDLEPRIEMDAELRERARLPLDRMLALG